MCLIATNCSLIQENSTRLNRVFVTCFNVTPEFAGSFKFWKTKGVSEFVIKYMEAAFDKNDTEAVLQVEMDATQEGNVNAVTW